MNRYKLTFETLLSSVPDGLSFREAVLQKAKNYKAPYVALFRNINFTSSSFGDWSIVPVGGNATLKTPEDCLNKWLKDLPSQRQHFQHYAEVPQNNVEYKDA